MTTVEPTPFQILPLTALHESPHNPRQHFDQAKLNELTESIRSIGVVSPLLVRPNAKGYEIIAGHRRYRASKLAKKETAPCVVRPLTDEQAMEILTIDNLQREDVHPLDEAHGYEALMAPPYRWKVEAIAAKVSKSVRYIYDSRALLKLTKDVQELFWAGRIDKSIAVAMTRLTPAEQATLIGTKAQGYRDGGLFRAEHDLYDEGCDSDDEPIKVRSVREVEAYIKRHIRFDATKADAFLYPETVKQVTEATQAKRKIIEITHEYLAGDDVRSAGDARVYGERAWKRADGKEDSKECERSVLGVIASGPGQGQAFQVCINKDRCTVHWGAEIKAREKRVKEQENGGAKAKGAKSDKYELEVKREASERAREEQARKQWAAAAPAILQAVADRVKVMPTKASGFLAELILEDLDNSGWYIKKVQKLIPRGHKADDLIRFAAFTALYKEIDNSYFAIRNFPKRAKALGIDLAKLLTPAVQTSAKPTTKNTTRKKRKPA